MKRDEKSEGSSQKLPSGAPDVIFQNVSCSVRASYNVFSKKRKTILHSVNGEFRSGELTAIVGPSGSGKTTLLHILAGYKRSGYTGSVHINEVDRFSSAEKSCYIMQDDCLHPMLTVREIMTVCSQLKMGKNLSRNAKTVRVNKIINAIGLESVSDTLTGNLSGGQRKRLGIALELIDNPPIMFFDEPTSGLDSSTTKQCITMLRKLARQNRAVICTLHQPSATVLEMFDHLYCLSDGRCCYSGDPARVTEFLKLSNLDCPTYHNPADFLLEVVCGDFGDYNSLLVSQIDNGRMHTWRKIMPEWANTEDDPLRDVGDKLAPKEPLLLNIEKTLSRSNLSPEQEYGLSLWSQMTILIKRCFLCTMRDKFHMYSRLVMHLIIGILIGIFFWNMGGDAGRVMNNFSLMFFSALFLAFSALQSTVISFPLEVPIVRKEHFNRWYCVSSYYLANTVADFPIQVCCVIFYCLPVYWMSGQPIEFMRFTRFTFICTIVSLLAQSIGYFVGSCMRVMNGVIFGPFFIMPFVMMSGYFLKKKDAPDWSKPLFNLSYLHHGMEGLAASIYGYARRPLPCISEDYCHFTSPKKALKELDMIGVDYSINVLVIVGIYLFFKCLTYFVIAYQLKIKR
ncbi:ABC-2 type transporter [Nesidiocoris tenuis]|uniref:ABC-2 type transporter n=1 Tax=Nesidiocoris tenuis TaxID=355587 RepID=A0ABN7APS4_9HEMI|nr:ABC-2 type transporter [Nesidiocoris tenuis]